MPSRIAQETDVPDDTAVDEVLARFSQPQFDAVDYLNEYLPTLNLSTQTQAARAIRPAHLQTTSSEVQSLLSKLNTHNIRASSELTSLTDEILRSGNRLAYEVEILRGDINSFYELLTETLKDDIRHFVKDEATAEGDSNAEAAGQRKDPVFITQLRMLGQVKARLEAVVAIFGEAMKWTVPPSELQVASSLISVSAPELGVANTEDDDKARVSARAIRSEIQDLLDSDGGEYNGLDAAAKRVEQYKDLATIWKGTAEERVRSRFVESLGKQVDDRKRVLDSKALAHRTRTGNAQRLSSAQGRQGQNDGGGGFFRNLGRLRDDLYLE
jgi:hypothetical protein